MKKIIPNIAVLSFVLLAFSFAQAIAEESKTAPSEALRLTFLSKLPQLKQSLKQAIKNKDITKVNELFFSISSVNPEQAMEEAKSKEMSDLIYDLMGQVGDAETKRIEAKKGAKPKEALDLINAQIKQKRDELSRLAPIFDKFKNEDIKIKQIHERIAFNILPYFKGQLYQALFIHQDAKKVSDAFSNIYRVSLEAAKKEAKSQEVKIFVDSLIKQNKGDQLAKLAYIFELGGDEDMYNKVNAAIKKYIDESQQQQIPVKQMEVEAYMPPTAAQVQEQQMQEALAASQALSEQQQIKQAIAASQPQEMSEEDQELQEAIARSLKME